MHEQQPESIFRQERHSRINAVCRGHSRQKRGLLPSPDRAGGWRSLHDAAEIRKVTGMDLSRLGDQKGVGDGRGRGYRVKLFTVLASAKISQ